MLPATSYPGRSHIGDGMHGSGVCLKYNPVRTPERYILFMPSQNNGYISVFPEVSCVSGHNYPVPVYGCPPQREESTAYQVTIVPANLTEALRAMNYPDAAIPTLEKAFPPVIVDFLGGFTAPEVRDIIETLLYVYTAQNSYCEHGKGLGVAEQSCFAYTPGPLFALKQFGLIEQDTLAGTTILRTTPHGLKISRPLMEARAGLLAESGKLFDIPPIVTILLADNVTGAYVKKTFPAAPPRGEDIFIHFLLRNNLPLFDECERFSRRLMQAGCAALAHQDGAEGIRTDDLTYVFPVEFTSILKRMIEETDAAVLERYGILLDAFRTLFSVVRYLEDGTDGDAVMASPRPRAELAAILERPGDAGYAIDSPHAGPISYTIRNQAAYDTRLAGIRDSLAAEVAGKFPVEQRAAEESPEDEPALEEPEEIPTTESPSPAIPDDEPEETPTPFVPDVPEPDIFIEEILEDEEPDEEEEEEPIPIPVKPVRQRKHPRERPVLVPQRPSVTDPGSAPGALDVFLGHTGGGEKVYWSPARLNNGHMIIIGGSGAGKTETIRCIASELNASGLPVILIDFHGDMACRDWDIRSYRIREGGAYYFNPLELDAAVDEITPLRATSDFVDAISINFPTLGIQQRRKIKNIVKDFARMRWITGDPATWSRTLDFDRIENEVMECDDEAIPAYLEDIFDYKLFSGDEKIAISTILSGGITHINLNALPENLRYLFADLFLRRIYYSLQAMGEIPRGSENQRERFRLFVIVDEAKLLVSQKSSAKHTIKAVLNKYATEMRKFGVSLILASQLIAHFNDEILANIAVKFCMRAENKKQGQENAKFFEVSERDLLNFKPGEGILIIGSDKMNVQIVPTNERKQLPACKE